MAYIPPTRHQYFPSSPHTRTAPAGQSAEDAAAVLSTLCEEEEARRRGRHQLQAAEECPSSLKCDQACDQQMTDCTAGPTECPLSQH